MRFASPIWLWLLAGLVPLLLLEWRAARRAEEGLKRLVGTRAGHVQLGQCRPGQRRLSLALRTGAFVVLVLGAAGPEWGREMVRYRANGSDVVLLVDVSASMDARDVPPSRMEETRREALAVLDRLSGCRVGVVAFAGDAVRLCPLTLDRGAVRLVLETLRTGSVSEPGTDLGRALRMAAKVLPGGRRSEQVIVLWTDGEDLERGAGQAVEDLARSGVRVITIGVGTRSGDVVPVLDDQGLSVDVKRDASGRAVQSRLDEALLRSIARRTGGAYVPASRPGGELPRLLGALGAVSRGARGERLVERAVPRFPWFAAVAAALLAFELGRSKRRRPEASARGASRRRARAASGEPAAAPATSPAGSPPGSPNRAALALVALGLALAVPARGQTDWARGDDAFRHRRYAVAESLYARRARDHGPQAVRINRATAAALAGRGAMAESLLASLAEAPGSTGGTAAYNLGTLEATRGAYDDALQTLRHALERDPTDADARYNLELVMRRKREQAQHSGSPPPSPSPSAPTPQGAGPEPRPGSPSPSPAPPSPSGPPPKPTPGPTGMDRRTAEQLLGSLDELERLERQRMHPVKSMRERRGRDW